MVERQSNLEALPAISIKKLPQKKDNDFVIPKKQRYKLKKIDQA